MAANRLMREVIRRSADDMLATADNVRIVASNLDHPEGLNFGPDGMIYAGGEAGQVYRIDPDTGATETYASVGGFLMLGVVLDGRGNVYGCHVGRRQAVKVSRDRQVSIYSAGAPGRELVNPNAAVFDRHGNLYFSDSGDYHRPTGSILIVRPNGRTEIFHEGPLAFPNGLAIDPEGKHLFVAQSTGPNIIRLRLDRPRAAPEVFARLPGAVPDGIAFDARGRLIVASYRPDRILLVEPDGEVRVLMDDPTGDWLNQPTNVALRDGTVYFANLGGWHIGAFIADLAAAPLHYPML
jgi:gluconolactonase